MRKRDLVRYNIEFLWNLSWKSLWHTHFVMRPNSLIWPLGVSYIPDFFYQCKVLSLGHLLDTYNIIFGRVENFLEPCENTFRLKKSLFSRNFEPPKKRQKLDFRGFFTFPSIFFDSCVVCSWFFPSVKSYTWGTF